MQLTVTQNPAVAYPGAPADDGFKDDISTVVEETNGIDPGLVVMRGTGGDRTARLPPAVAADVDAIATTTATAAGELVLDDAGELDGSIGLGLISPPSQINLIMDSNADWDATSATLVYLDENGVQQTESLTIPDGGNATVSSVGYASNVVSLTIPAQSGTGGSFTVGVGAASQRSLAGGDVLGVSVLTNKTRTDLAASNNETYLDEQSMPVRRRGRIYVEVENAFTAGDRPLVRVVAAGEEKLGAIRVGDTDSGDCISWPNARLLNSGSAGALGVLEVDVL